MFKDLTFTPSPFTHLEFRTNRTEVRIRQLEIKCIFITETAFGEHDSGMNFFFFPLKTVRSSRARLRRGWASGTWRFLGRQQDTGGAP